MSVDYSIAPARRRTFAPYVLLYIVAALLAGAYLVFLGVRPDLIAMWRAKPDETKTALIETQQQVARAIAEIDPLKQGVGQMQADVAGVKAELSAAAQRDQMLMDKMETLERAASEKAPMAAAAQPKKQTAAAKTPPPAKPAAAAAAAPAQTQSAPGSIETGSIEDNKKPAAAPAQVGVLLATGPSVDSLRLSWTILNDRAPDTVRSLHPRYVVSGKDGQRTFGLVAGPLETIADAKSVCKTMTERGMACEVSQFRGNAF